MSLVSVERPSVELTVELAEKHTVERYLLASVTELEDFRKMKTDFTVAVEVVTEAVALSNR